MNGERFIQLTESQTGFSPFSNGTEALFWLDRNCYQCQRSIQDRLGAKVANWDDSQFQAAVRKGTECGAKYALDCGFITGILHPEISVWMGGTAERLCAKCSRFTDNPEDAPENTLLLSIFPDHMLAARDLIYKNLQKF